MTKEEAKKALEEDLPKVSQFSPKMASAYKVAISALSSEEDNTMEWIEHKNKRGIALAVTCSKCLKPTKQGVKYPFCPHCGRKAVSK